MENRLIFTVAAFIGIILIGMMGFMVLEDLSFVDAAYFTVTTVATVGYGDIVPQTTAGKLFAIVVMMLGVSMAFYTFSLVVSAVIEGKLKDVLGRRGVMRRIEAMKDHIIVCGAGKVGSNVIARLQQEMENFVVIEMDAAKYEELIEQKTLALHGDATLEQVLMTAGVMRAKGVITALSHDADNVYVTLTAKSLNPALAIVARADRPEAEEKLLRAGANTVIFPNVMGGRQMVQAMVKPVIMDLMENVFDNRDLHLDMAQISIAPGARLANRTLSNSGIRDQHDAIVVAIKRETALIVNPKADERILEDDILIVMGNRDAITEISKLASNV